MWSATTHFTPWRKFSGVFRYGFNLLRSKVGLSDPPTRRFLWPSFFNDYTSAKFFAHEVGHLFGLPDYSPSTNPNNPSIMTKLSYTDFQPKKSNPQQGNFYFWTPDIGSLCNTHSECPYTNFCGRFCKSEYNCDPKNLSIPCIDNACDESQKTCRINCGKPSNGEFFLKFSRGKNTQALDETSLHEIYSASNEITKLFGEVSCFTDELIGERHFNPYCSLSKNICAIDWNEKNGYEEGPVIANLNKDTDPPYEIFYDQNDWKVIYDGGKNGLSVNNFTRFFVFLSNFDGSPDDVSGWENLTSSSGISYVKSSIGEVEDYGFAAKFGGPGSGDYIVINSSPAIKTMGMKINGISSKGFIANAFFYVNTFQNNGSGHQIFDSPLFQIDIVNRSSTNTGKIRGWVNTGSQWKTVEYEGVQPNQWYRVVLKWNNNKLILILAVYNPYNPLCEPPPHLDYWECVSTTTVEAIKTADIDPGDIYIGFYKANPSLWGMDGLIDEVVLINDPGIYYPFCGCFVSDDGFCSGRAPVDGYVDCWEINE